MRQKQLSIDKLPKSKKEHGGSLSHKKRRSYRPLSMKQSLHITLRSEHAMGPRSLLRHRKMIEKVMWKAARHFRIRIYNHAICGNHLHVLVKGNRRIDLQNFFRVFAGHTAQNILRDFPLPPPLGGAPKKQEKRALPCKKNQRKFWALLIYSRIISWGREYRIVLKYITQNTLEALHIIAYKPRAKRSFAKTNTS